MAEPESDEKGKVVGDTSDAMSRMKLREDVLDEMREREIKLDHVQETGNFANKWSLAAPYHIFYSAVQKSQETWKNPLCVTFYEILDRSLGEIVQSLHVNFVVNFEWLIWQYSLAGQQTKMMVLYGTREDEIKLPSTIEAHLIECPNEFGCHHPKVSILQYKDGGIRIIVSSANLFLQDWDVRTQGLWISPHLPRLDESAQAIDGESRTRFKSDFLSFLFAYGPRINEYKRIVQRADCSSINVVFFACVPGNYNSDNTNWGHKRLAKILKEHTAIPDDEPTPTTIIAQASSVGCFGPNYGCWITTDFINSMSNTKERKKRIPELKCIFPTLENYKSSYDGEKLTNCLGYDIERHEKQKWIIRYMHKWKADRIGCTHAMPHIKTFTRISADEKRIWWFVLGSSNFSKAAWGNVRGRTFSITNYEANVVFLPKFVTGEKDFPIKEDPSRTKPIFPIHYDLPLTPYSNGDKPFVGDYIEAIFDSLNSSPNSEELVVKLEI